ncbi:MAG: CBS domain-containing protein [Candidatus Dadabacteria bacterium]|nr:CBS domain-containing protein [Candidatus Dadabacteria bacterium]NIS08715.1 CBS domain-containing protein [Candidatus Dadabacteria bacterium]NIV42197.1 CBS domain-containing protein [Candidatus Dadabacteria bacterium]NIX15401.1 CBS domain-containing protein [Candidatus Dadabacteria bacterium]NIY22064.1 CBS domain-containing protein [Candidatus Dadabacteria bacterium]
MNHSKGRLYLRTIKLKSHQIQQKLKSLGIPDYTIFVILSIVTGAASGSVAVFFHKFIEFIDYLLFDYVKSNLSVFSSASVVLFPVTGMMIIYLLTKIAPKVSKRKGVMEVIKAVATRGGHIPFRTTLFNFIAPSVCIGSGCTLGPEGPAAQLGGGIASKLGRLFGLSDTRRRMFTAAGAGAAIAAVFRTPMGGVFFALEVVLLNDFQAPIFSALILASVTASAISQMMLGDKPIFFFDDINTGPYSEFYLYAVCGILAGGLSVLFIKYAEYIKEVFKQEKIRQMPKWQVMGGVGLLVGISGLFFPEIFGVGYKAINGFLSDTITWEIALVLFVLKFVLVPIVLYAGGFGGLFAPSLFMGASFGFVFSIFLNQAFGFNLDTTAFTLVSMGAFLGAVNSIPVSAILIIFEMTQDYSFILPLMLSVVSSTTIAQLYFKGSIYSKHLEEEGYHITQGHDTDILKSLIARDVMRDDIVLIPEHLTLPTLISKLGETPHSTFYTVNEKGKLVGTILESELRPVLTEYENLREMIVAGDIAKPGIVVVRENDDLDFVLKLFGQENLDEFPVISSEDPNKVLGSVNYHDILAAYNRETLKHHLADGLVHDLKAIEKFTSVKVSEGYSISEQLVPRQFVGKTLAQLRLRNVYGIEVLMIRPHHPHFVEEEKKQEFIVPRHDYTIEKDDILIVFGKDESIMKLKNL